MRPTLPALVGSTEIAELAGVDPRLVATWIGRYDDFPTPIVELALGRIYLKAEVEAWLRQRRPQTKPPLTQAQRDTIRARVGGGEYNVSALAREFDVTRKVIYGIAGDLLGIPSRKQT